MKLKSLAIFFSILNSSFLIAQEEPAAPGLAKAVDGWKGGFATSNPAFAYPDPDFSTLKLLDNLANIPKITRQQKVLWPEFSWEVEKGNSKSRCFQMFAPDISRLGYDDRGRIWSIICPQQGFCYSSVGCMNVEVTVTGQRGWVDESNREIAADMSVEGKVWFSPSAHESWFVKTAWALLDASGEPFPSNKANAIRVTTHLRGNPKQAFFPVRTGESKLFEAPEFARHEKEAWSVATLEVEIGPIRKTADPSVNRFNELVMELFNAASGNMLQPGNVLTWNVWLSAPELVDTKEWAGHAEKWRKSIDADHGSPGGTGTKARYADGSKFSPAEELLKEELEKLLAEILRGG